MTSLKPRTGSDGNKQTGSNLTVTGREWRKQQQRSRRSSTRNQHRSNDNTNADASATATRDSIHQERSEAAGREEERKFSAGGSARFGTVSSGSSPGISSTSTSTPVPVLTSAAGGAAGGGRGGGGVGGSRSGNIIITSRGAKEVTTLSELDEMRQREVFFEEKYDPMTGVRIASTLGGFFLIVLLTLLYKSKCKSKQSREISLEFQQGIAAGHQRIAQNIQVNVRPDFGSGGSGGDPNGGCGGGGMGMGEGPGPGGSPGNPMALTLLDSSCYGYMNQVHPANSHTPIFSNCYTSTEGHVHSPAVLLITSANSESSDEELSVMSGIDQQARRHHLHHHPHPHQYNGRGPDVPPERKRLKNAPMACRQVLNVGREHGNSIVIESHHLHPRPKSPPRRSSKGIDINVILPTPSISPSGSENFNLGGASGSGGVGDGGRSYTNSTALLPGGTTSTTCVRGDATRRLLVSRSLSSDNENDVSEMSDVGGTGGGGGDLSECSDPAMLPFGCGNSSLFSLDNLKYVDDTSSENIPTRASDADDQDQDQDTRSIGSDSVFACFEHNFDHVAPTYARRVSSISGTSSAALVATTGMSPPQQCPILQGGSTNNNNNSVSTVPSVVAPPPPTHRELLRVSSIGGVGSNGGGGGGNAAGGGGGGDGDETEFRVTLTQAHVQVHHRDSFCSDLESVNDYMETGARRRSSSTQTTLSDLRQSLGNSPLVGRWSGVSFDGGVSPGSTSLFSYTARERRLSVPRRRRSLSPHFNALRGEGGRLLSPTTPVAPPPASTNPNSTSPFLSVTLHPPPPESPQPQQPPQPPPTLNLLPTTTESDSGNNEASEDATPTNPPTTSNMMSLSPTSAIAPSATFGVPPRMMRKRSFEAVRKTLSLQCDEKSDTVNLYVSSSNETTPTN